MGLTVLGGLAFDAISIDGGNVHHVLGGSAVYAGFAASLVGPVTVITATGDDCSPAQLAGLRGRPGLDLVLQQVPGRTTRFRCDYSRDLSRRTDLALEPGVAGLLDVSSLPGGDVDVLFLASGPPAIQLAMRGAVHPRLTAVDTIEAWIQTERADLDRVVARSDAVLMTAEEVQLLADRERVVDAASVLLGRGPRLVCVKQGEYGARIFGNGFRLALPAFDALTVDPTGAGDAFAGAFLGYLAREGAGLSDARRVGEALVLATAVSSVCVEGFGTRALEAASVGEIKRRCCALLDAVRLTLPAL